MPEGKQKIKYLTNNQKKKQLACATHSLITYNFFGTCVNKNITYITVRITKSRKKNRAVPDTL